MKEKITKNIKSLAIDMIQNAGSGHPGIVLGASSIVEAIYENHLHFLTDKPNWINRDRFVLSSGHGSAMLYATLFLSGFNYTLEDLKNFRKLNSKTPGHPEYNINLGIEMTTGPLGQGIATSVGMALGQKILAQKYGEDKIDYYVYVLCGDGDLMEGISYEAMSFAGTHCLDHLIILYDSNNTTLDGKTSHTFTENVMQRFKANSFETFSCDDHPESIDMAIKYAKNVKKPVFIEVKTTIGKDSFLEGNNTVHGGILKEEDYKNLKIKWNIKESFSYDEEIKKYFTDKIYQRSLEKYHKYEDFYNHYQEEKEINIEFRDYEKGLSLRELSNEILNDIASSIDIYSGSADLSSSCKTYLKDKKDIYKGHFDGKNIFFGIREHAMGAINNGLLLTGIRTFISTFLVFSDYMIPSIRLSALMNLPAIYIFSHDSILVGEDGATHEPIEQLPNLRNMPNLTVYRPCNREEMKESYLTILKEKIPSVLIISKEKEVEINKSAYLNGYNLIECEHPDVVLASSGSDIALILSLAQYLQKEYNLNVRVVSIPCLKKFLSRSLEERNKLLPKEKTFILELSNTTDLDKLVMSEEQIFKIHTFGKSGSKDDLLRYFSITNKEMSKKIVSWLGVKK